MVAIARYGALVRGRISGWFDGAAPSEFERVIKVYYGPQSGHDLLERTTWHAAQHLRQLYALAERLGITPPGPLPTDAFQGLPLPDALVSQARAYADGSATPAEPRDAATVVLLRSGDGGPETAGQRVGGRHGGLFGCGHEVVSGGQTV